MHHLGFASSFEYRRTLIAFSSFDFVFGLVSLSHFRILVVCESFTFQVSSMFTFRFRRSILAVFERLGPFSLYDDVRSQLRRLGKRLAPGKCLAVLHTGVFLFDVPSYLCEFLWLPRKSHLCSA